VLVVRRSSDRALQNDRRSQNGGGPHIIRRRLSALGVVRLIFAWRRTSVAGRFTNFNRRTVQDGSPLWTLCEPLRFSYQDHPRRPSADNYRERNTGAAAAPVFLVPFPHPSIGAHGSSWAARAGLRSCPLPQPLRLPHFAHADQLRLMTHSCTGQSQSRACRSIFSPLHSAGVRYRHNA
jgi:hypothetical protein